MQGAVGRKMLDADVDPMGPLLAQRLPDIRVVEPVVIRLDCFSVFIKNRSEA
jgi:hypothetical protein